MTHGAHMKSPHKEVTVPVIDRAMAAIKKNGREGLSTAQLSRLIGVTVAALQTGLEKLRKKGLLDKRRGFYGGSIYSITAKGMEEESHENGEK